MKPILFLFFCVILFNAIACKEANQPKAETVQTVNTPKPSLAAFTDTLEKLKLAAPDSISRALRLYSVLAPYDSTGADSAAAALMQYVRQAVEKADKALMNDTVDLSPLLDPTGINLPEKLKALDTRLHATHLKPVSDGEGGVYLTPDYGTILPTIQAKTSQPVDDYLNLAAKEDTSATFKDAGLSIEMPELVDRLIASEQLLTQKLPTSFSADVKRLNTFYTNALIRGADNSPALDQNTTTLTDEFQKGYDYLLAKYPSSKAAAKINVWIAVVKSGDKRKIDDYLKLLD
jgi:ABC-type branched-subunit amino acid transport system substrate-binding protein